MKFFHLLKKFFEKKKPIKDFFLHLRFEKIFHYRNLFFKKLKISQVFQYLKEVFFQIYYFFSTSFLGFRIFLQFVRGFLHRKSHFLEKITGVNITLAEIMLFTSVLFFIWKFHEPLLLRPINLYDEGVSLLGAKRFLNGELPYTDFFTIYSPLKFSLLAFIFEVFGTSFYVARYFFLVVSLLAYAVIFLFFWKEKNAYYAALFTLILSFLGKISLTPLFLMLLAIWFSALLQHPHPERGVLSNIPFFKKYVHAPKKFLLPFHGGVLLGFLFLLRIDFGGFAGLSIFFLLLLFTFFRKDFSVSHFFSVMGKMGVAFLAVVFPVFLILFSVGAFEEFWEQTLVFPLFGEYKELRHLPWPAFSDLLTSFDGFTVDLLELSKTFAWFFFPIPFLLSFGFWIRVALTGQLTARLTPFFTNMFVMSSTVAAFIYASHRSDYGHVIFLNMMALILFFHTLLFFQKRYWGLIFSPLVMLLLLYPTNSLVTLSVNLSEAETKQYSFFDQEFPVSGENDDLDAMLRYFEQIPAGEKVYVGVSDTSRVFINNIVFPFLIDQKTGTKYHELHTGIVTKKPTQLEMIEELEDVNYVVIWDFIEDGFECEPNKGCESTGVFILDEYIRNHYRQVAKFGKYKILIRNNFVELAEEAERVRGRME